MASGSQQDEIQKGTVTGGMDNTSKQHHGPAGGAVIHKRSGGRPRAIYQGGDAYYEDPDQPGRFRKNTRRHDYIDVEAYAPQAAAPSGGGGGGGGTPDKPKADWRDDVRPTTQPTAANGATVQDIMGNTYDNMVNWTPISSDGQGGTQHINPLVDPLAWMAQPNPAHQVAFNDPGVYVNPQVGGILTDLQKQSQNPYSLLG